MNSLKSLPASRSQTGNGSGFPPTLVSPENLRGVSINAPNAGRAFRVPSKRLLDPVFGQGQGGLLGASTSRPSRMKSGFLVGLELAGLVPGAGGRAGGIHGTPFDGPPEHDARLVHS